MKWPVAGFALPAGEGALRPGRRVLVTDAFISLRGKAATGEAESARLYLDFIASVLPRLEAPPTAYQDWPALARKSLAALRTETGCCRRIHNRLFIQAYVGSSEKPPESMVQGAVMVPLTEYQTWRGRPVPLLRQLRHYPASFYHEGLQITVRWLLGAQFDKQERSEEEQRCQSHEPWCKLHGLEGPPQPLPSQVAEPA